MYSLAYLYDNSIALAVTSIAFKDLSPYTLSVKTLSLVLQSPNRSQPYYRWTPSLYFIKNFLLLFSYFFPEMECKGIAPFAHNQIILNLSAKKTSYHPLL